MVMVPGFLLIFLRNYEIKFGSSLGMRLLLNFSEQRPGLRPELVGIQIANIKNSPNYFQDAQSMGYG